MRFNFNASDKNCLIYFRRNPTNTILISKIKSRQHAKILRLNAFHDKCNIKMLNSIRKFVFVLFFFHFQHKKQFTPYLRIKICVLFCSFLRRLKSQAALKICQLIFLRNISYLYYKRNRKTRLVRRRILEKRVKHSATSRQHFLRALSHHKRT